MFPAHAASPSLLGLPFELRLRIYKYHFSTITLTAFAAPTPFAVSCNECGRSDPMPSFSQEPTTIDHHKTFILRASRQVCAETKPLLRAAASTLVIQGWGNSLFQQRTAGDCEERYTLSTLESQVSFKHLRTIRFCTLPPYIDWSAFPRLETIIATEFYSNRTGSLSVNQDWVPGSLVRSAGALYDLRTYPIKLNRLMGTFREDIFTTAPRLKSIQMTYLGTIIYPDGTPDLCVVAQWAIGKTIFKQIYRGVYTTIQARSRLRWKVERRGLLFGSPVPSSVGATAGSDSEDEAFTLTDEDESTTSD